MSARYPQIFSVGTILLSYSSSVRSENNCRESRRGLPDRRGSIGRNFSSYISAPSICFASAYRNNTLFTVCILACSVENPVAIVGHSTLHRSTEIKVHALSFPHTYFKYDIIDIRAEVTHRASSSFSLFCMQSFLTSYLPSKTSASLPRRD